jgi:hypothetical protein
MNVTHIQTPPYRAPRRTHAANSDTRPRRAPRTRRPPVTSAVAALRRAAEHAQSPHRHSI